MKKTYLIIAVLVLLSLFLFFGKKSFNLVIISVDSLRPDSIKANAPNISKFSESATVFKNAYTVYPTSVGSYYTLFTGNNYLVGPELSTLKFIDKFDATMNKDYENLASRLQKNGYKTEALVANPKLDKNIFKFGFDEFKSGLNNATVSKNAVERVKSSFGKKFFLWVDFKLPDAVNIDEEKRMFSCIKQKYPVDMSSVPVTYGQNVKQVDVEVGKVMAALKETGLDKNTLIVVYSDKGESFDPRFYGLGKTLYNSDVKSVLAVKKPFQETPGQILDAIDNSKVSDLVLNQLEMKNFPKKINEFTASGLTFFRISYGRNLKVAVADQEFKYIYNLTTDICLPEKDASEFYDLVRDPNEKNNLIGDPKRQRKIAEMRAALSKETMVPIKRAGEEIDVIDRLRSLGY
jgi:arylsulfatase A-like enzyme